MILFRGEDRLLLGDQVVSAITIRDLDEISSLSQRRDIFQ